MSVGQRYAFLKRLSADAGAMALDFWHHRAKGSSTFSSWDAMAGLLLVEEAGGHVAPFPGPRGLTARAPVLASANGIAESLFMLVRDAAKLP
jgi:fructose-1,6-bisphosphatase/inositol monophosphatase family enzyme